MFSLNSITKSILRSIFLFVFIILSNSTVSAKTNPYLEITNISANKNNNTITYIINSDNLGEVYEYGLIISNNKENLFKESNNLIEYNFKETLDETISITVTIPKNFFYYNLYTKMYVLTENEIIYSNEVYYIYADIAGLDKIIIKEINYENGCLTFLAATTLINNDEFGVIFSKNQLITDLNLENAENDHFETEIIKLEGLNQNNEFRVNIRNIPIYDLNISFKSCVYTKNYETKIVNYSNTTSINILEQYNHEIINNMEISYNNNYDGIKYFTKTLIPNNKNYIMGFVLLNRETNELNINTPNAFIIESGVNDGFILTMNKIPESCKNEYIYIVAYLKFINEDNEYEYYYSDIYKASYNQVKETYLINNS